MSGFAIWSKGASSFSKRLLYALFRKRLPGSGICCSDLIVRVLLRRGGWLGFESLSAALRGGWSVSLAFLLNWSASGGRVAIGE